MVNNQSPASFYKSLIPFEREKYYSDQRIRRIGSGSIGGKARGLVFLNELLSSSFTPKDFPQIKVGIPNLIVICTDVFDEFMESNDLYPIALSDSTDDRIAYEFQKGDLPFSVLGDLRALIEQVNTPLAIRSSSLLEDATYEPFAGVYTTKMIPNHQHDPDSRFNKLTESIKLVYASVFFNNAKNYRKITYYDHDDEKMAVIIQDMVGKRHNLRFYPDLSGVARSYNYYPVGRAKHKDGVVNLALGLGKTIVDGGISWAYSPAYPQVGPLFGSIGEMLDQSQKEFWAVNMGSELIYDPIRETEYLVHENLTTAEKDDTLRHICSTYDPQSDRLTMGISQAGPRALNFEPLLTLREIPMNDLIKLFMEVCENKMNTPVEIEFAMTFDPHCLEFLQVRPMVVSTDVVEVTMEDLKKDDVLVASENVLGNGVIEDIQDVVFVIPDKFDKKFTQKMASEIEMINSSLLASNRSYLLIVFGRLGSSDPWLGIPVKWEQISGARVIIEATQQGINVEMSQGSHFFHNMTSLGISYISVPIYSDYQLDWAWLEKQEEIQKTKFVRHIRLQKPLKIKIDGRIGRGAVFKS